LDRTGTPSFGGDFDSADLVVCQERFRGCKLRIGRAILQDCRQIDPLQWAQRSHAERFLENSLRLMGPVL
jgi:hypothetical protein